jgi:hypothetical protein
MCRLLFLVRVFIEVLILSNSTLAYLTNRSAVDKLMVAEMANTFASRFGPAPFTKLVSELQRRHHAELELQYLAAAEHFGFHGPSQIPQFSPFDSTQGFAGCNLSVKYTKNVFIEWFNSVRIYFERVMASQGGIRLAGDHTFSVSVYCLFMRLILSCC